MIPETIKGYLSQLNTFYWNKLETAQNFIPEVLKNPLIQWPVFFTAHAVWSHTALIPLGDFLENKISPLATSSTIKGLPMGSSTVSKVISYIATALKFLFVAAGSVGTTYGVGSLLGYSVSLLSLPVAVGVGAAFSPYVYRKLVPLFTSQEETDETVKQKNTKNKKPKTDKTEIKNNTKNKKANTENFEENTSDTSYSSGTMTIRTNTVTDEPDNTSN